VVAKFDHAGDKKSHSLKGLHCTSPTPLFDGYQGNQRAMVAALPGLRPGATVSHGERITRVMLTDDQMALRWKMQSPRCRARGR
jgi:hypothetical protein